VAYAVIPRCESFGDLTGIDAITGVTSHELIEASTDPYPFNDPAYAQVDQDHYYWSSALGGGEVGDLCAQNPGAFTFFDELPYAVQRTWSNVSIAAGHDPCVPEVAKEVYFNVVPELDDQITLGGGGSASGVSVPLGTTKTITLDLYSDGPTSGPFTVKVIDAQQLFGGTSSFKFALDKSSGVNGDKIQLTITTNTASKRKHGTFAIESHLGSETNYWFGLIGE
jgi:hypothetical protein